MEQNLWDTSVSIFKGMCHSIMVGAPHLRSLDSASHRCRKLFLPGLCLGLFVSILRDRSCCCGAEFLGYWYQADAGGRPFK